MNDAPSIGHNKPPLPRGEDLQVTLALDCEDLVARAETLFKAEERVPTISTDELAGRATDYGRQVSSLVKALDAKRKAAKDPYLEAGNAVDGFFKRYTTPLEKLKERIGARLTRYLTEKKERELRERETREREARIEAERLRRIAEEAERKIATERDLQRAIETQRQADDAAAVQAKAEKAVKATPAEMSRTRGDFGALASLRTTWDFDEIDRGAIDLEALRNHLPIDALERGVRSFIKAGGRELRGVHIFESHDAVVR